MKILRLNLINSFSPAVAGLFLLVFLQSFALGLILEDSIDSTATKFLMSHHQFEIAENFLRFRHPFRQGPQISEANIEFGKLKNVSYQNWCGQSLRRLSDENKKRWLDETQKMSNALEKIYGANSLEMAYHYRRLCDSESRLFSDSKIAEALETKAYNIFTAQHNNIERLTSLERIANHQQIQDFDHKKLPYTMKLACQIAAKCDSSLRKALVGSLYYMARDGEMTKAMNDLKPFLSADNFKFSSQTTYPNDNWLGDEVIKITNENKAE